MSELKVGQPAPIFKLPTDSTGTFSLSDQRGKNVVIFFYPKDSTSGCTIENVDFTALMSEFEAANTVLIGISADSLKRHENFRAKNDLRVILGSDPDKQVIEQYGVWVEKQMYGKTHFGIERATFLVDEKGNLAQIWRKVKAKGHAQAVLDEVKARQSA
ncbi:peroxiredoxin [Maritalea porphyrae]|uniref:thioredoxin-dependent peroxiredoxin n=1 Tax=Maritalea porphyrae TaxID=880732 RepID=A0ABQ5UW37_9HYPH|nr:peroxiredoxin [Maritalea porphyrae]GLQ18560.1 peroxiredoxin [Maritalea porphyrae]